jgi:pSer/pThr/pTyr-binding forkhead associated (FHA) protein
VTVSVLAVFWGTGSEVFDRAFSVGRHNEKAGIGPDLSIGDDYLSTLHAGFYPRDHGWTVCDLGSTNGTWIGAERIYGERALAKGDEVRIGRTVLTVVPA